MKVELSNEELHTIYDALDHRIKSCDVLIKEAGNTAHGLSMAFTFRTIKMRAEKLYQKIMEVL